MRIELQPVLRLARELAPEQLPNLLGEIEEIRLTAMERLNILAPVPAAQVNKPVEREYVSVADAAMMTGISRWMWRKDVREGRIDSVKRGKRLLIPVSEIRRLINEGLRPANSPAARLKCEHAL